MFLENTKIWETIIQSLSRTAAADEQNSKITFQTFKVLGGKKQGCHLNRCDQILNKQLFSETACISDYKSVISCATFFRECI